MRILFVNYELPPVGAGAGNATANIAHCLAAEGDDVHVLTASFRHLAREERRDGYTVHRVPSVRRRPDRCSPAEMLTFTLGGMVPAVTLARRRRPDIVCAFFGIPSGPIALLLRQALGIPYVVSLRGGDVPGFMGTEMATYHALTLPIIRAVWRRSAGLIANGAGLAELARRTWPEAPIAVIPNGIDVERFRPLDRQRPAYRLRLLSVGRLVRQKGISYALAGLARSTTSAVLRIVGDGPERPALARQAAALGLAHRVEFTGWVERSALPAHYQWADALLLPSLDEGMANVLLEALASGLPAIASDIYGNRELVQPGHNGFLVPPRDPGAIASAIETLAGNAALVRRLGESSRQVVLARSWICVADQYRSRMAAAIGSAVPAHAMPPTDPGQRIEPSTVAVGAAQTAASQRATRV